MGLLAWLKNKDQVLQGFLIVLVLIFLSQPSPCIKCLYAELPGEPIDSPIENQIIWQSKAIWKGGVGSRGANKR